ncbi:MAG TPA: enoyl-CoA hydratase/isomerase [Micropepsaceae bacterium]|nr:enoyl-CoA hydratase/isomerase [Micropepsaceae bacterium]
MTMIKDFERVRVEHHGTAEAPVGVIVLNHPEVMNAVSPEMLSGLRAALDYIENPAQAFRAIVLTGEGRGFCTGANLSGGAGSMQDTGARDAGLALEVAYHPVFRRLRNLKMPLITAVNGPAAGVGMSFALMGDMILAARSAFFLQAFRRIGLVPDGGSTWLLPRLVGLARAKELSLMGERLPAETALQWGLINRVHDDAALMGEALKLAGELASGPTVALGLIRQLYAQSPDNSYEEQINAERWAQFHAGRSPDFAEGVAAFLQKRPAKFTGK